MADFGWKIIETRGRFSIRQQMNSSSKYFVVFEQGFDGKLFYQLMNRRETLRGVENLLTKLAGPKKEVAA